MKKILLTIIVAIAISWGFLYAKNATVVTQPKKIESLQVSHSHKQTPTNILPQTFSIPSLNITTPIESVGLDATGKMDVPQNADNVAWYNLGHKIGSNGSAVIAGHYDKVDGAPAAFYDLSKLKRGETISITMQDGSTYTYKVIRSQTYDHDKVPLEEAFNTSGKALLNLITCEGTFNKNTNLYSKRLVVYSELVN